MKISEKRLRFLAKEDRIGSGERKRLLFQEYFPVVPFLRVGYGRHSSVSHDEGGSYMEEKKFILTISRRYGCGGRELANILAEKLGVHLYDRQIVHLAAAKLGINDLHEKELLELENTVKPLSSRFIPFHSFGMAMGESSQGMFMAESNVVRKLADDGPCIFLGRCADYALRKRDDVFSIFVCADDDYREERGRTVYEGKTLKEMDREDEKRARYYDYYTGRKWGDGAHYDLVVNAGRAPLAQIADGIIAYIRTVKG